MTKNNHKTLFDSAGFAAVHIAAAIVVVGAIGFVGGSVYTAQQKQRQAASQKAADDGAAEKKALEEKQQEADEKTDVVLPPKEEEKTDKTPAPAPAKKPVPEPTKKKEPAPEYTKFEIQSTSADVQSSQVVFTASLGKTYSGKCAVSLKAPDGSYEKWFEGSFSNKSSCTVSAPREKLTQTGKWTYVMYYYNDAKTVKGYSSSKTFQL
jgi:hypothetical protein